MVKYIIINMYIYDLFRLNVIGAIRCRYEGHKQGWPAGQTVVLTYIGQVSRFRVYMQYSELGGRGKVGGGGTNTGITNCNQQQQKQHK